MTITAGVCVDPARRLTVAPTTKTNRDDAWSGATAMLPLLASYTPFGCLVGVAVAHSSSPIAAWTGVWLIFGGTAHLIALQLTAAGSGVIVAAMSALAVNVRLLLYSATIGRHWRGTSLRTRLVAAATIVDPTWMLASRRFATHPTSAAGRRYYAGASLVMWFGWAAFVTGGMLAGNVIPPGRGLELLAPLCLVAMVAPGVRSRSGSACAVTAAAVNIGGSSLPSGTALLLSMVAGACAGTAVRRWTTRTTAASSR
jgi:predicted branched-subunit amino acid permease